METIRITWRLIFFVAYTTRIVAEIWLRNVFQGQNTMRSMRIRRRWAGNLLKGVGLRITVEGEPPQYPCLLVGNHRSYVDPILVLRDVFAWPVAKAEVADWPVLGRGAQMAGILYLKREDGRDRAAVLNKIGATIQQGYAVVLFPEGTTGGQDGTMPFKKGGFVMAVKNNIPVIPVAICFADPADYWVGQESFLQHAGRRFRQPEISVKICYGPALRNNDADQLLEQCQSWINDRLNNSVSRPEMGKNTTAV
jgi:1-acyl-sn-glycerol-3-phosphate acyltransferase